MNPTHPSPEALLSDLGIERPEDIDIEAIAQYCGATIVYEALAGCEARIIGQRDRAIITVNTTSNRPRQRFSAAHELGHWMRDRGNVAFACAKRVFLTEWYGENPERRANRYAADLLLPDRLFAAEARGKDMTLGSVQELAQRYQTSLTATAIRLVELGSFPAMLICNERGSRRWKWFVRGPDVPARLWPADEPGGDALAFDLLRNRHAERGPAEVAAAAWFDQESAERYAVVEESIRSGNLVLTMLWWRDQRQLLESE